MAKCMKCGKSTLIKGHVKLADGAICTPCFRSLGFKLADAAMANIYKYDEIKEGLDNYYLNKHKEHVRQDVLDSLSVKVSNYGQERERIATESELEIFEIVRELSDREELQLVRKSDNYVSAVIGDWDLARFKYTSRAKWIMFPVVESGSVKNKISDPQDVRSFADLIAESLAHIDKYS